ncbi:hypothetical protein D3C75_723580 [compost metagenome]
MPEEEILSRLTCANRIIHIIGEVLVIPQEFIEYAVIGSPFEFPAGAVGCADLPDQLSQLLRDEGQRTHIRGKPGLDSNIILADFTECAIRKCKQGIIPGSRLGNGESAIRPRAGSIVVAAEGILPGIVGIRVRITQDDGGVIYWRPMRIHNFAADASALLEKCGVRNPVIRPLGLLIPGFPLGIHPHFHRVGSGVGVHEIRTQHLPAG